MLINGHCVVHVPLLGLADKCVLKFGRIQLVEWVLSESQIVADEVREFE